MTDRFAYKIFTQAEFKVFQRDGSFAGSPADLADGFIHMSTASQLDGTLDRHYKDHSNLILAAVDLAALGNSLRWEESRGGQLFPHLYGSLPMAAVSGAGPVERAVDGALLLPA